ncbi:putative ABC transporter [Diaporthe sp. PMI_573]|nr:putative ABC transporter [Diaporthaceae sp. PMI_573]
MSVESGNVSSKSTLAEGIPSSTTEVKTSNGTDLASGTTQEWHMAQEVRQLQQWDAEVGSKPKKLGVSWQNLTVTGVGAEATFNENILSQLYPFHKSSKYEQKKTIIDNSFGSVKPGEMLLVLGRPGAGCTTLLSVLANNRLGYEEVTGDVTYGNLPAKEAKQYRGEIIMNTEEEIFFPTLTVEQTTGFATRMKVPYHLPAGIKTHQEYVKFYKDFLLRSVGISHTAGTKVGDAYIRGVSGGERKRVSILEVLTTRGSVFCWDNSTRGLDASTALEWVKAIRVLTDVLGLTTIITLYQAGNGIYEQFDKVLVLDEGKQIYYGPQKEAVPFMESLGFARDSGSNRGDFLTGVTVPHERIIAPGYENSFPRTAQEIRNAYDQSKIKPLMLEECQNYPNSDEAAQNTAIFKEMASRQKHKGVPDKAMTTAGFATQGATLIQALLGGSLFYDAPDNSLGLFLKGGALFFSLLYNSLLAMGEVTDSFTGRPILAKHRSFALYHPAAVCIAQIVGDIPILAFQVTQFGIVLYWMTGLKATAGAFFTYLATTFITALSMTSYFRFVGAAFPTFDAATKVSGLSVVALFVYMGYMIIKPQMHPWLVWIFWINPMAYGFEALLSNEFHNTEIPCYGPNLIPNGAEYAMGGGGQACAGVVGAPPGASMLTGDQYLDGMSFSHSNVWRNFGINVAWWIFYAGLAIFFTSRWKQMGEGGRQLLIPRELHHRSKHLLQSRDEEAQPTEKARTDPGPDSGGEGAETSLLQNKSIFTWKNLTYTVSTPSGNRVLLDNVHGYVKPGMLGALMGSSGAGKTTLLDVLAQRKTAGTIHGSVQVDGRPLSVSFQRSTGYVEQLDVHEPLATVREALEFSALLRQSRDTPDEEKLRYVDTIVDLLELNDLEHTLIGRPGAGLSVEQRKRLTIGVELVAKPSVLIFLDEPTSGLDGQAAFNTVRFLRKLTAAGQAVLVTIHQPSAQLFAQFDKLLLLTSGGKTVYFGDIGTDAKTVKEYFGRNGAPCPPEANPAEHMIDIVSGQGRHGKDWNRVWLQSREYIQFTKELDGMIEDAAGRPESVTDDGYEFAASIWTQTKLVTHRMNVSLFRNTDYLDNKFAMHISLALLNSLTFLMIGDSLTDLQQNLFTIFNFIFVAPGVISQLQPLFIDRRDIFEAREKKSKMYHWGPFVTGLIVSEFPYLLVCAVLYYVCWYFIAGLPTGPKHAGSIFLVTVLYELLYTGIGQSIAAYTPNAVFASLVNPLVITTLVSFCGVMTPYSQIVDVWKYSLYYVDPFNYLMGALLTFTTWDKKVDCKDSELAVFDPAPNQTCGDYLEIYQQGMGAATNLLNPGDTSSCQVCQYSQGSDYLKTLNIKEEYYGWRNVGIVFIFVLAFYGLVYLMMKLRTKATKKAED